MYKNKDITYSSTMYNKGPLTRNQYNFLLTKYHTFH